MSRKSLDLKPCVYCKDLFKPSWHKIKYCSRKCFHSDGKSRMKGSFIDCLECGTKVFVKRYLITGGKRKAKFCGLSCKAKNIFRTKGFKWQKGVVRPKGALSHAWKGGKTSEAQIIRSSTEYANWRNEVFKRDSWTCKECGVHNNKLHPHHIKSFAEYPELRLNVSNGITLCHDCHKRTPNYGRNLNVPKKISA